MSKPILLLAGLVGGAILALGVQYALRESEGAGRTTATQKALEDAQAKIQRLERDLNAATQRADDLEQQKQEALIKASEVLGRNEELRKEIEQLRGVEEAETAVPAAPERPLTDDEIMQGVGKFGASLQAVLMGGGEDAKKALKDLLSRAGEHGIELLVAKFEDDATDLQTRAVLAHALAQSGSPEAIGTLTSILADPESGMLEMRLATHGLAFSDAEGIDDALLAVAHRSEDTGARANAAFGLARRKHPEGIGLYAKATDEAMANRDPAGLQYLSGFFLLGDEGLPPMRERLLTYTEPQTVITLIELLKMKSDKGAIENLRKLAEDKGRPESVRKSAEGALKVLEAPQ